MNRRDPWWVEPALMVLYFLPIKWQRLKRRIGR